ncbi:MAG: LysM peptidoglycan-binding domain-containing protein [Chloroflexi bacterium]|nr:LysM peptidoglycan-binding domain-containing protein [Chloroflexota bacterium]
MDPRAPSNGRDRRRASRSAERPQSTRRGYAFPRAEHRHPVYGTQARRESRQMPYVIGFIVVVLGLAAFLYIGLNWATGPGRVAALATPPTPTAVAVEPPPTPEPSPTVGEQTYVVKAGDSPASIAQQFRVRTDDLMAYNNIADPQKLQIGQTLKIPRPGSH